MNVAAPAASPCLVLLLVGALLTASAPAGTAPVPGPWAVGTGEFMLDNTGPGSDEIRVFAAWPVIPPGSDEAFPLIVFGHGLGAPAATYGPLLTLWASWGFVVLGPETFLEGSQQELTTDMLAVGGLIAAGGGPSDLADRVDGSRLAFGGHSMGGGAAVAAGASSAAGPDLVIALAPWVPEAGETASAMPVKAAASLEVPLLVVVGALDDVTPVATDATPIYEAATGVDRLRELVVVPGAGHTGPQVLWDVAGEATVGALRAYLDDEHAQLDVVYGPSAQAAADRELTYEVVDVDCFVTGVAAPGEVLGIHGAAAAGTPMLVMVGAADTQSPALPCLTLGPSPFIVILAATGRGQLLSLVSALPAEPLWPPGAGSIWVQTIAPDPAPGLACSPAREIPLEDG